MAKKKIIDVKGPGTVNICMAQNWIRHFKEGDTILEDKPRSGRPSVVKDEALLDMVGQQSTISTHALLAELGPSQSTINQHLHKLGLVNRL